MSKITDWILSNYQVMIDIDKQIYRPMSYYEGDTKNENDKQNQPTAIHC